MDYENGNVCNQYPYACFFFPISAVCFHSDKGKFQIGWARISITPDRPVFLAGQCHARISEGVWDPVTANAMAMDDGSENGSIMVRLDLVSISQKRKGM